MAGTALGDRQRGYIDGAYVGLGVFEVCVSSATPLTPKDWLHHADIVFADMADLPALIAAS